jgi:hypothetical protein
MFQFVLELLDAVVRERKKKRDPLVRGFGFADFVGLERRKIVLLRLRSSASGRGAVKKTN